MRRDALEEHSQGVALGAFVWGIAQDAAFGASVLQEQAEEHLYDGGHGASALREQSEGAL